MADKGAKISPLVLLCARSHLKNVPSEHFNSTKIHRQSTQEAIICKCTEDMAFKNMTCVIFA